MKAHGRDCLIHVMTALLRVQMFMIQNVMKVVSTIF